MAMKSSFKNMTLCLLAICLVCSALLAVVYALTAEPIAAAAAAKNEAAIMEVLPDTAVSIEEERKIEFEGAEYTYNLAYDKQGNTVGCAINVRPLGFGGPIIIKVGIDAAGVICNTKVLSQSETPGLGAKCTPYTSNVLMDKLGLKSKEGFRRNYLRPAIDMNLIQMTIPDKPNSRNQKYQSTAMGLMLIDTLKNNS